jgi:uncharacterized protein YaiL (DUF2058 family)
MSESLRDQLLKSGLGKKLKEEAKPAQKPVRHPPVNRPGPAPVTQSKKEDVDLARAYAIRARTEREERERAQRDAERIAREKKERKAKLASLLDGKSLNNADADVPRHFPHGNKIRRVYCTPDQLVQVNRGDLGVVQLAGRYLLVSRDVASQAQSIQPEALVLLCDPNAPLDDDVPADLVW